MIPYRPITPLTVGPRSGWRSVLAAVVMAAVLGTTATSAGAAPGTEASAVAGGNAVGGTFTGEVVAAKPSEPAAAAHAADPDGSGGA